MSEVVSGILDQIGVGTMIAFQPTGAPDFYVNAVFFDPGGETILAVGKAGEPGLGNTSFTVTMYEHSGNQAKISLQSGTQGFWMAGQSGAGLATPLVLGPESGQFVLTDTGQGITIENTFAPPGPYVRVVGPGVTTLLCYGFDTPDPSGLFNILVVG